ncbi:MAG: choice-of-anchor D domain-containing protein [Ignavibacteria bacterium]|nr:choice-of-anchor D domain-containing protein [Ignavibacteria bacterium]
MKKIFVQFSYLLILFSLSISTIYGQKITAEQLLFNSSQGKEYWIAIPPNEDDRQPYGNTGEIAIEIYVTSSKNCMVTLEIPGMNFIRTKKVEAFRITTFSTLRNELFWNLEVRESEAPTPKAIRLTANEPISVYVLNHRGFTADGYLAVPMNAWGTEYIHLSYYDFREDNAGGEFRGGGFIIIPSQVGTEVLIELKGRGATIGRTIGGRKIGDKWKVSLNPGDVYCVMGDGTTRGVFDLSGSRIIANKPIGFISFHKRTLIPSFDLWNGRNMLCEMMPPVQAWGKKYYTVEFQRKGRGDFFRIIAARDNTTFTVKWYDIKDGKFLGQRGPMLLRKSGDFAEFEEVYVPRNEPNQQYSIRGTSVWEADKPVLVMQYSYSTDWDNAPEFDPFMILVVPREQFVPNTVFQTPEAEAQFLDNYFNIIAIGDTNDPSNEKLKSITIDGKPIWEIQPQFLFNRIPGTDLYWAKLMVKPGAHVVRSKTKFSGYIYGFSNADGYGWPACTAFNKVDETDTLPPEIFVVEDCGIFTIRTTELRNGKPDDDPRQIDQGISEIFLLDDSYNTELKFPKEFKSFPPNYDFSFIVKVINKRKPALAHLQIIDRAGNSSFDTLYYYPDTIEIRPRPINFGKVRLYTTSNIDVEIKNASADTTEKIKAIYLKQGTVFSITNGNVPPEIELPPLGIHSIKLSYTPADESLTPSMLDIDTLFVVTDCDTFKTPVVGRGVIPKIAVEDWDAGPVQINFSVCKLQQTGVGLLIQNPGTDTLVITGFTGITEPFYISSPFTPQLDIIIPPRGTVFLETPCFKPTAVGNFEIDVTFHSNAGSGDSVSNWKGSGIQPGPYITNYDWHRRRVGTSNEGKVFLRNSGTSKVRVTDIKLGQGSAYFKIKPNGIVPNPTPSVPVDLMPENSTTGTTQIEITVLYEPQAEFEHSNTVIPEFHPEDGIPPNSVIGSLQGYGYLPKIQIRGYEFQPPVLVGTQHPDIGSVVIKSVSQSADLFISSINFSQNPLNEFEWVTAPPTNIILPMGDSLVLPVRFTPRMVNRRTAEVNVINDASPAPDSIITTNTTVIGYGIEKGIIVDSINYGLVLLCDEPIKEFTITNTSSTTQAIIDSIAFISGDKDNFELVGVSFPMTISPMNSIKVSAKFSPNRTGSFRALFRVYSDVGNNYFVELIGASYNTSVALTIPDYGPEHKLAPGYKIPLTTTAKSRNWRDASITAFEYYIIFKSEWFEFQSIEKGDILDNTWNVRATQEKIDEKFSRIRIIGNGTNPINRDGILSKPLILLMLTDAKELNPYISNITFFERDKCVVPSGDTSKIVFNTCVVDMRPIVIATTNYFLEVNQNPVVEDFFQIKFGVSFEGNTKIDLINLENGYINPLLNEFLKEGTYELTVNAKSLSSGVYAVRLLSNGFSTTKKLIISK